MTIIVLKLHAIYTKKYYIPDLINDEKIFQLLNLIEERRIVRSTLIIMIGLINMIFF